MNPGMIVLGLTVIALATIAGRSETTFHPRHDLLGRSILAGAAVVSVLSLLAAPIAALALTIRHRLLPDAVCVECLSETQVHPVLGIAATVGFAVGSIRLLRVARSHYLATQGGPGGRIAIVDTSEPLAYAIPRGDGCVVVSTGMLDALDGPERQVVFAHERAHLRQNHHRHLLVAACAETLLPFLAPLASSIRLATERCADEAAVEAMSGDRRLVAQAILRAAVHANSYERQLLSFGGGSVVQRVCALDGDAALLTPPAVATRLGAGLIAGLAVTMAIQAHHLAVIALQLCSI